MKHDLNKINQALWETHLKNSVAAMRKYPPLGLKGSKPKMPGMPDEVHNLNFSLLFTPEMVHHVPVKVNQPEGLKYIKVVCPNCTDSFGYPPPKVEQNPDELGTIAYADVPIVTLKEYRFTERDFGADCTKYGWIWVNRCMRCNHLLYVSKWKVETAIERIVAMESRGA